MKSIVVVLLLIGTIFAAPSCTPGEGYCSQCSPLTNLCLKCENPLIFVPNEEGSCSPSLTCTVGLNYCEGCDEEGHLCNQCSTGYYPDENGGCSQSQNCQISNLGECLYCKENYILIGSEGSIRLCKHTESEDLKNCQEIDYKTGHCDRCEDGYYLGREDRKCTQTAECALSVLGQCIKCRYQYYLDHSDEKKCKFTEDFPALRHCIETENGETCSKCENEYFFDEGGKCTNTNFCAESENFKCIRCLDGYYLSSDENSCVTSEHCRWGQSAFGICNFCTKGFYIDNNDATCKPNTGDDDLKYCESFTEKCDSCESDYYMSADEKCTNAKNCAKVENGVCLECIENVTHTVNNFCVGIEHCIESRYYYFCDECEDGYFFSRLNNTCYPTEGDLEHCKVTSYDDNSKCVECKSGYYFSHGTNRCESNEEEGPFYKCHESNDQGDACRNCIDGYYLGTKDRLCTTIEGCATSEGGQCIECGEDYCLNLFNSTCVYNYYLDNYERSIFYKCLRTNSEGTKCETCIENYTLTEEGICYDDFHCVEKDNDGNCLRCEHSEDSYDGYCINKEYGCVYNYNVEGCIRCDSYDFDNCTQCDEGYIRVLEESWNDYYCEPEPESE